MKAEPRRYHWLHSRSAGGAFFGFTLLLAFVMLIASSGAVRAGSGPVESARISQRGDQLVFEIKTDRQIALKELERTPDLNRPRANFLCVEMTPAGSKLISRICLGGKRDAHHRVGVTRANRANRIYSKTTIPAKVERVGDRKLLVSFKPGDARLKPAGYSWQAVFSDGTCGPDVSDCRTSFPKRHAAKYRIRPLVVAGCTGGNGQVVRHGPRGKKRIALTFDDGPSLYTPQVLHILKAQKVKATFFMLATEVERYPDTARRVLKLGHEIASHSTRHALLPSASDIRHSSAVIKRTTGFKPCLFRPPYGALNSSVIDGVRRAKMKSVIWDIDTTDWQLPGAGSIANTLSHAGSGSIVLMHDGGGPRNQTVAALSGAIKTLKRRGFDLVTVSELLGDQFIYRLK